MITSSVTIHDGFGELGEMIDRASVAALNEAAAAGRAVAEQHSAGTGTDWAVVPAHGSFNGFVSGLRANNPIWRVFNKGSLGKRTAALKEPGRRKDYWTVSRGSNPYTAVRHDVSGKGVSAKNISNPARTVGRRILIERLRHLF